MIVEESTLPESLTGILVSEGRMMSPSPGGGGSFRRSRLSVDLAQEAIWPQI